ncbi:MAG: hypothetical protein HZB61_08095 [Nitrospirae bacterium]|nr:hypothetical protein [Nitrospirota bacterium]
MMKSNIKKIIGFLILSLAIAGRGYSADEFDEHKLMEELGIEHVEDKEKISYQFPEIKPEATVFLGHRLADSHDLERAFEYEYMKDSPVFSGDLKLFRFPHRLQLDFDLNNRKDYQGDVHYAFGELFIARWSNNTFFHNLENINLTDLDTSSSIYGIDIKDKNAEYGIKSGINNLLLRLKTPDFPAHAYIRTLNVNREGEQQQRSLSGTGYFQNVQRATQKREIDWNTLTYTVGANSHLGPVEVDFSHAEKRFDIRDGEVMHNFYEASAFRPAGTFPHNQFPELKGSSNEIKIHNNYTESLSASATFSLKERSNKTSGATADIFKGTGILQWTPLTRLSLFLRYSHIDTDADNPNTASIKDINGSVTTYTESVKPSISKTTDIVSLTGRYKPETGVMLLARYQFENIERDNADDWNLEDSTRKNTALFSADIKVMKGLKVKANYIHRTINSPSYNTEPDNSDEGAASISWLPSAEMNFLLNYSIASEKRNYLVFSETQDAKDRKTRTDNILGSGTFKLLNNLSFTASYAFLRYKIQQDIVYDSLGDVPLIDSNVSSKDTAHVYSASFDYVPVDKLNLVALVSHTRSTGEFLPNSQDLLGPISISSLSRQKTRDTVYQVSGEYEFKYGFSGAIDFKYSDIEDILSDANGNSQDGDAYIIILRIKKRWG